MSSRNISDALKERVIADWKTGDYRQRDLAHKHKISLASINNLVKGVEKSTEQLVNNLVKTNQALKTLDETNVHAVSEVVDRRTKRLSWLENAAMKNASEAMLAACTEQRDFKDRADTITKTKEILFGKEPQMAVQINNSAAQPKVSVDEYARIAREALNR